MFGNPCFRCFYFLLFGRLCCVVGPLEAEPGRPGGE